MSLLKRKIRELPDQRNVQSGNCLVGKVSVGECPSENWPVGRVSAGNIPGI